MGDMEGILKHRFVGGVAAENQQKMPLLAVLNTPDFKKNRYSLEIT